MRKRMKIANSHASFPMVMKHVLDEQEKNTIEWRMNIEKHKTAHILAGHLINVHFMINLWLTNIGISCSHSYFGDFVRKFQQFSPQLLCYCFIDLLHTQSHNSVLFYRFSNVVPWQLFSHFDWKKIVVQSVSIELRAVNAYVWMRFL